MPDYVGLANLTVEKADTIATVTLNRPDKLNAFNWEMHQELDDVFVDLGRDEEVNAIVLTGAGEGFFSRRRHSSYAGQGETNPPPLAYPVLGAAS